MVRTDIDRGSDASRGRISQRLWIASLVVLPYASYVGLLMLLSLFIAALVRRGGRVMRLCARRGFGWLAAGMLLSACFAMDRGEGFLILTNFLPFFVMFGVMATVPVVVDRPFEALERLASWLLISSIPMTVGAIAEFIIKFESIEPAAKASSLPSWLLDHIFEEDFGHRAHSVFSHPNMLSAYLAILLGLGLGLVLKALNTKTLNTKTLDDRTLNTKTLNTKTLSKKRNNAKTWAQGVALLLCLVAIFCTGSRNGLLIAGVLLAIALYAARRYRWVLLSGLAVGGFLVSAMFAFGIGGRSLSLALVTQDPRLGVWRLAIEMIQQRPLLGWGFSSLRQLYIPGSIPDYDVIYHAHNFWLYMASEAGIPVMVGFCLVIGTIYYDGVKAYLDRAAWQKQMILLTPEGRVSTGDRSILLGYLLAFASVILFALFDVAVFDSRVNLFNWGLVAAIYALSREVLASKQEA